MGLQSLMPFAPEANAYLCPMFYVSDKFWDTMYIHLSTSRDLCYDHNFLRFLTIFGEKIGVFLKNQCYDQIFA
jgi:hypothetical protein